MKLQRTDAWRDRFETLVRQVRKRPFAWRTWNCAHFAAAVIEALCGHEIPELVQLADDAELWKRARDPDAFAALISNVLGPPIANPGFAHVGDIVLAPVAAFEFPAALGVCTGPKLLCVAERGLIAVSRTPPRAIRGPRPTFQAWKII